MTVKLIVIDCETSGPEQTDQIIELAWVGSKLRESLLYKLPTNFEIHPSNTNSGITKALLDAEGIEFNGLPDVFNDRVWISYNVQHDINWINHTLISYGHDELEQVPSLCLAELVKDHLNLAFHISMEKALDRLGIKEKVVHRALPDAIQHAKIFQHIMARDVELVKKHLKRRNPEYV